MEWAAFNDDDSQRREHNRHHHREGDFDDDDDQNQKQGLIRGENENNNDAETQKRKRRTAEAEETRIAGSYETAIRLLAEEEEEDNNKERGENVILKEEAKREEAKQILLAVVNHEMMRENDELTPTLCSVKKLALRNLGNLFAKECGEFEFEEEEFEGIEDDKDDDDDDGGEKQRREKLSSKSSVSPQSYSFEQAIRCYSEAVRMDREDVASWLRMGELSAKRGDVALARMAFESGLLAQPTHALLLNELCEVCVLVGDEASATFLAARILNSDRRNERMKEIQTNFANAKPKERLVKARERFERVNARKDISAKGTKYALTLERMAWDDVASSILGAVKVKVESEESAIRAKDDDEEEEEDDEDDDEKGVAAPSTPPESSTPTRVSTPSRKGTSSAARSAGLGVPVEFVTSDTITAGGNKNKNKKQKVTTKEKTP